MKPSLHLLLCAGVSVPANAFSAWTGSSSSAFTRTTTTSRAVVFHEGSMLMYDSSSDPPNKEPNNMWSVLANTERWLSDTLSSQTGQNPYTRKEVTYVCETSNDGAMIVAGIFRRLREARELGESHGQAEEERWAENGESYSPRTLRQTNVVVIPSNEELKDSFVHFDNLVEAINQARRNARDYITDVTLEKLDDRMYGEGEREWSVSVNCAHLHPSFGEKTPERLLQEMKDEEKEGEVDLNLKAYKEKKLLARRSPYPTVVIEVRASPPPDFGQSPPQSASSSTDKVTSEDIQKLEALFGKSATFDHPTKEKANKDEEDDFYDAIGQVFAGKEILTVTPMILAQNWIAKNDNAFDAASSTFTSSDVKHVDEAYEFAFINLAMQISKFNDEGSILPGMQQYLVLSNFMTSSATSFEKFAAELTKITNELPGLATKVHVSTFHPEHVDRTKRSPVPVLVWSWV